MRVKKLVSMLMTGTLMFSTACHSSSSVASKGQTMPNDITPIVTRGSSNESGEYTTAAPYSLPSNNPSRIEIPENMEKLFADNFLILDNSNGRANVYEINVTAPFQYTREWEEKNGETLRQMTWFEAEDWTGEDNLIFVKEWFLGKSFSCYAKPQDEVPQADNPLIMYNSPEGTFANTIKSINGTTISSIPNGDELPFATITGIVDPQIQVPYFTLDGTVFPREACFEPGKPVYFPKDYDELQLIGLVDKYIDGIPVLGTLNMFSIPTGVFDYGDILQTAETIGIMTQTTIPYRNKNIVVIMTRTGDFSIKSVVKSDLPIKSVFECKEGIEDSLNYLLNVPPYSYSIEDVHFYAAELVYLPLSNFDVKTYDFPEDGKTYLVPVWNLYFEAGRYCPYFCVTIDAITGQSLYSKEYSLNDPRLERPDPEMKGT